MTALQNEGAMAKACEQPIPEELPEDEKLPDINSMSI
jgi:hypothetical protein